MRTLGSLCGALAVACSLFAHPVLAQTIADATVTAHARALLFGDPADVKESIDALGQRGQPDIAAAAILALRFRPDHEAGLLALLRTVTGGEGRDWHDWMLWQEGRPDVVPHAGYANLLREVLVRIDPGFLLVLADPWVARDRARIRLEEVTWGGVGALTGIPSLDTPPMVAATEATYLEGDDLVFGVSIAGDSRAYPLRIMGWHEMLNDVIGGVPVALAYCTLCGSGILYETVVEGRTEPFVFGSSGLLYRSNKLMFDWETKSLWNQFTGEPAVGPLASSGIVLQVRPLGITSWRRWRERHPDTTVLSIETGHRRDYGSGIVYADYFASPGLMFPARVGDESVVRRKDYVFGIREPVAAKAWPLSAFEGGAVINDAVGARAVVLIGDAATREVRAYDRESHVFTGSGDLSSLIDDAGRTWAVGEEALIGPDGLRLPRVAGDIAYWFAWDGYLGVRSELYRPD